MVLSLFGSRESERPGASDSAATTTNKNEAAAEPAAEPKKRLGQRRTRRTSSSRSTSSTSSEKTEGTKATAGDDDGKETKSSGDSPSPRRRRTRRKEEAPAPEAKADSAGTDFEPLLKALEEHNKQLSRVIQLQEELLAARGGGAAASTAVARVGVFVDAANIELAADRSKKKIDWGKVLDLLTRTTGCIRAVAYSPTHDDPGVSMETQRFVEPFLDKGFKIVTKPLKRFADGSIKANVDIEMALDIMSMCDRLDIVCLVSGDGDFVHLVEVVQSRGVRVEVVGYGQSTAGALRKAGDDYIDLEVALGQRAARGGGRGRN